VSESEVAPPAERFDVTLSLGRNLPGKVIGLKGCGTRAIRALTGCTVAVDNDAKTVSLFGFSKDKLETATGYVNALLKGTLELGSLQERAYEGHQMQFKCSPVVAHQVYRGEENYLRVIMKELNYDVQLF
jgi:rRNA processing protein Krr1/Pno1